MTSMDRVAKHRTERGSAGSTTTNTPENGVWPGATALGPCLLTTVHPGHQLNNTQLPHYYRATRLRKPWLLPHILLL